jgi:hypothetical protein
VEARFGPGFNHLIIMGLFYFKAIILAPKQCANGDLALMWCGDWAFLE